MQVTDEMLKAAIKKAVEYGMLPRQSTNNDYLRQSQAMQDILQAALDVAQQAPAEISEGSTQ